MGQIKKSQKMAYEPLSISQQICLNLPSPRRFRLWIKAIEIMARQLVALPGSAAAAEEQPKERLGDRRETGRNLAEQGWKIWYRTANDTYGHFHDAVRLWVRISKW